MAHRLIVEHSLLAFARRPGLLAHDLRQVDTGEDRPDEGIGLHGSIEEGLGISLVAALPSHVAEVGQRRSVGLGAVGQRVPDADRLVLAAAFEVDGRLVVAGLEELRVLVRQPLERAGERAAVRRRQRALLLGRLVVGRRLLELRFDLLGDFASRRPLLGQRDVGHTYPGRLAARREPFLVRQRLPLRRLAGCTSSRQQSHGESRNHGPH